MLCHPVPSFWSYPSYAEGVAHLPVDAQDTPVVSVYKQVWFQRLWAFLSFAVKHFVLHLVQCFCITFLL